MSSEWSTKSFGDLIDQGVLEIGDGYRAKNDELGGNGLMFLRAGHVRDTQIDFNGVDCFRRTDNSRFGRKISQAGDVVITTKGNSTGRVAYVSHAMPAFVYSPHLSYWRSSSKSVVDQGFLRAWAQSEEFSAQLAALSKSTDMAPYLSLSDQRRLKISLPPLAMQWEIAELNDAIFDRIALLRETNATVEAIAQALFKSWFVDFDPVRAKQQGLAPAGMDEATAALFPDSFEESALGQVPKGWTVRALDEVANYLNGLALQKFPPSDDSWLPVIKIAQLRKGDTVGADRAGKNIKPEYVVQNGDVLFSWSGSLEVEVWCGGVGALNQHLFKVTSKEFPKWFYFLWTRHHLDHFRQIAASKATTMGHIQRVHLTEAKVLVPPASMLKAVDACFASLLDRRIENELQTQTLTTLRDTLLPRLISGQLRLPEVNLRAGATA